MEVSGKLIGGQQSLLASAVVAFAVPLNPAIILYNSGDRKRARCYHVELHRGFDLVLAIPQYVLSPYTIIYI